ncbi:MAG: pyruvate, water dikinase regulatory protein [Thermodesulfobacteriota bacterium]|nr:pyruvate, water dikinase regulatory protein [Thermodesulfobacteriota bacterium]
MTRKRATAKRPSPKAKTIYLVGEGTGETISKIAKASLSQFSSENVDVKTFFQVTMEEQIERIAKEAAKDKALVAFSVIRAPLRNFLMKEADRRGVQAIDVIGDFIFHLSRFLEQDPMQIPGRQHALDDEYYRRIEAINFTVKHDDGKLPQGLTLADLVLVGLSRSGKTPLSIYLAHQGWKVANLPLHPDLEAPEELFQIDQHKVFGLSINVENLVKVREARLEQLGLAPYAKYADPLKIADEIDWCELFYEENPTWKIIDISDKAIEEAAASILNAYTSGKKPG